MDARRPAEPVGAGAAPSGAAPAGAAPDPGPIHDARQRLRGVVHRTPLERSDWLSEELGVAVHLKLESTQATRSFKLRGASNAVALLSEAERERGLVTASAGNHGLAVATAARRHGVPATVFVPAGAPETKKRRIRRLGARLREVPGSYDDAAASARAHAEGSGATFVHPFADPAVVAGQGTVGLEIVEDLPDVRTVLVPVGGGGLAAGVGAAVRAVAGDDVRVVGVQSSATRAMHAAFEAGRVVPTPVVPTLCDGLAGEVEPASFEAARAVLDGMALVDEAAIAPAIRSLYLEEALVTEGAGAVGVAAALAGVVTLDGPVVIILTGGNIDASTFARVLRGGSWAA